MSRTCLALVFLLLCAPALSQAQQPAPSCDEQLAMAQKVILILRAERDRAQEAFGQTWSQAERLEKAQKAKAPEEKKDETK